MSANMNGPNAAELCAVIDDALDRFRDRNLVTGSEVVDFLLDLRLVLDLESRVTAVLVPVAG